MYLKQFLKSQQFKMICSILLILFLSIVIKMSIPDSFEYLKTQQNITFRLKFKGAPFKLGDFEFSVKNNTDTDIKGTISEGNVNFNELSVSDLPDLIELTVTSQNYKNIHLEGDSITKKEDSVFTIPTESIDDSGKSKNEITLTADLKP